MPHPDAPDLCRKIDAALDYLTDNDDELRASTIWQVEQILDGPDAIRIDDCTTAELMALLAVLLPIFSRSLSGAPQKPRSAQLLTLVLGDGATGT